MTDMPTSGLHVVAHMAPTELGRRNSQRNITVAVSDKDGKVIGDMYVSKSGLAWRPRHQQEPIFASWADFVQWMGS